MKPPEIVIAPPGDGASLVAVTGEVGTRFDDGSSPTDAFGAPRALNYARYGLNRVAIHLEANDGRACVTPMCPRANPCVVRS